MNHPRPKTDLSKAIPLIVAAAFFNALMLLFAKLSTQSASIQMVLFYRFFITLLIIMPFIYFNPDKKTIPDFLKTQRILLHLIRDISGLISIICYFYAAKSMPLADATVLFYTSPLFIPIVAFFWGGLKIVHRLWWGMGLGFCGVIIILNPGHEILNMAAIAGLLSGVFAAITFVGGRYLTYSEPPLRNMFYYFFVGSIIAFTILLTSHIRFSSIFQQKAILLLIAVGIFGYLYQLCLTYGSKYAPVRLTSSFLYVGVIFSIFFDWLLWQIRPGLYSLWGILCVIGGACILLFLYPKDDYKKHRKNQGQN